MGALWVTLNSPELMIIDIQVDESMENLEEVVRERNRAFYELEVGGSGEQEREITIDGFGLESGYTMKEHDRPIWRHPNRDQFFRYR